MSEAAFEPTPTFKQPARACISCESPVKHVRLAVELKSGTLICDECIGRCAEMAIERGITFEPETLARFAGAVAQALFLRLMNDD